MLVFDPHVVMRRSLRTTGGGRSGCMACRLARASCRGLTDSMQPSSPSTGSRRRRAPAFCSTLPMTVASVLRAAQADEQAKQLTALPNCVQRMDPQLRKLLEVAYEAWIDSGLASGHTCSSRHPSRGLYGEFMEGSSDCWLQAPTSMRFEGVTGWAAMWGPAAQRPTGTGSLTSLPSQVC